MDHAPYVEILRRGGVVACPTETLMGLLADARNPEAVARVLALKARPQGDPLGVLLPDADAAELVAEPLSLTARALAARYWPGPLTLVTWAREDVPAALVRDGKVGLRVPGPSPALELVRAFAGPLTATSCNPSGEAPATTADEARAYFGASLDAVVPGRSPGGLPSTVYDVTVDPPRVLRDGILDPAAHAATPR